MGIMNLSRNATTDLRVIGILFALEFASVFLLASQARADWSTQFNEHSSRGEWSQALSYLEGQSFEIRITPNHMGAVLFCHKSMGRIAPASEFAATLAVIGSSPPGLSDAKSWLLDQGRQFLVKAQALEKAMTRSLAPRAYLFAIEADPTLLSDRDAPLAQRTLSWLRTLVGKPSTDSGYWFHLARFAWLVGEKTTAREAMKSYRERVTADRFELWKADRWIQFMARG